MAGLRAIGDEADEPRSHSNARGRSTGGSESADRVFQPSNGCGPQSVQSTETSGRFRGVEPTPAWLAGGGGIENRDFGGVSLRYRRALVARGPRTGTPGRVGNWRAYGRVRWRFRCFRVGPQSGSHGRRTSIARFPGGRLPWNNGNWNRTGVRYGLKISFEDHDR